MIKIHVFEMIEALSIFLYQRKLRMYSYSGRTASASNSPAVRKVLNADELEKYVTKVQNTLNSPREKKLKSFAFARLYYDSKDYVAAKKYLTDYLSVNERDYRAHNLMGELSNHSGDFLDAINSYKRSLELCSSQKDIILRVVELLCKAPFDPQRAKVSCFLNWMVLSFP